MTCLDTFNGNFVVVGGGEAIFPVDWSCKDADKIVRAKC